MVLEGLELEFAAQPVQFRDPFELYDPALHGWQSDEETAAVTLLKYPAWHIVQACDPLICL